LAERLCLAGELTLSCAQPAADGPTGDHYVGKPSATGQPTQPFILPRSINEQQARFIGCVLWRHLVSACEVKAHLIGCWQYLDAVCFWQPLG